MTSKKKLVISLSIAAAVLVCAIVAIVAVFAAGAQTITSNIKVTFRASDVDCVVSGTYKTKEGSQTSLGTVTIKSSDVANTAYGFPTKEVDTESKGVNVDLSSSNNSVDFVFEFTNKSARGFTITLDKTITAGSFSVKYSKGESAESYTNITDSITSGVHVDAVTEDNTTPKAWIKISVSIEDFTRDAELDFNSSWVLTADTVSDD